MGSLSHPIPCAWSFGVTRSTSLSPRVPPSFDTQGWLGGQPWVPGRWAFTVLVGRQPLKPTARHLCPSFVTLDSGNAGSTALSLM